MNHTSDQHPWFQSARSDPGDSPYRDWHVWSGDRAPGPVEGMVFHQKGPRPRRSRRYIEGPSHPGTGHENGSVLMSFRDSRLVGGTRAERRAPPGHPTRAARGPAGVTDTTTMPDQPTGSRGPLLPGQQRGDVTLDLFRVVLRAPAEPPRQPGDVSIYHDPRLAEGLAEDHVGRLAAHSRHKVTSSSSVSGTSPPKRSHSA